MKIAIYKNSFTGETHELAGVKDLAQAWRLADSLMAVWGWNCIDLAPIKLKLA